MQATMESVFCIAYLAITCALGLLMASKAQANKQQLLFGALTLVLVGGDAFHLVPRIYGNVTGRMAEITAALGFGTFVTSITMTVFYVMLYHFWCGRYKKPVKSGRTLVVYALAVCRVVLCLFPQNGWLLADAPPAWGIYRNIPFALLGAVMVCLFLLEARRHKDKHFRLAWLAVLLSFLFYFPVVLWADSVPLVGMLMIPKTVCYVWLVLMGARGAKGSTAQ